MTNEEIVKWLRSKKVETGGLLCLGCGQEHNCGIHGCTVMRAAADAMENMQTENAALRRQIDNLSSAQAVMVKEFDKKLEELHEAKSELAAMRNELCCKCGNYREAHNGACDGCRWKKGA